MHMKSHVRNFVKTLTASVVTDRRERITSCSTHCGDKPYTRIQQIAILNLSEYCLDEQSTKNDFFSLLWSGTS